MQGNLKKIVLFVLCYNSSDAANLTELLDANKQQTTVPAQLAITFEKRSIDANPHLADKFIEFAQTQIATADEGIAHSVIYIMQKYPESITKLKDAAAHCKTVNQTIQQALEKKDAENNRSALRKAASLITASNLIRFGLLPLININYQDIANPTLKFFDAQGIQIFAGNVEVTLDKDDHTKEIELVDDSAMPHDYHTVKMCNGLEFKPVHEWPAAWLSAITTSYLLQKIHAVAGKRWGWNTQPVPFSWSADYVASTGLKIIVDKAVADFVHSYFVFPAFDALRINPRAPEIVRNPNDKTLNGLFSQLNRE